MAEIDNFNFSFNIDREWPHIKIVMAFLCEQTSGNHETTAATKYYDPMMPAPKCYRSKSKPKELREKKTLYKRTENNITDDSGLPTYHMLSIADKHCTSSNWYHGCWDYDDSNIYTAGYTTRNLGKFSKRVKF